MLRVSRAEVLPAQSYLVHTTADYTRGNLESTDALIGSPFPRANDGPWVLASTHVTERVATISDSFFLVRMYKTAEVAYEYNPGMNWVVIHAKKSCTRHDIDGAP